LLLEVVL